MRAVSGRRNMVFHKFYILAFVRLLLLLQLLLPTKNLTSRELKARNSLHFCLTPKNLTFEFIAAHDLI